MPQIVTIRSLPEAFNVIKEMQADGCEWGEDYRGASREALAEIIQGRMREAIDRHLDEMARRGEADRRNGFYHRHLLTELDRIELCVPRTRRFNAIAVVRAYPYTRFWTSDAPLDVRLWLLADIQPHPDLRLLCTRKRTYPAVMS